MSTAPDYIGRFRFRYGGRDCVASLFYPATWHLEGGLSPDAEHVVLNVLRQEFDPRKGYGPADGGYGCAAIVRAAQFFKGTPEVPEAPEEPPGQDGEPVIY